MWKVPWLIKPKTQRRKSHVRMNFQGEEVENVTLPQTYIANKIFKWSQINPTIYDQILKLGKPLLRSMSLMKTLLYSIRNNWCQIWWFERALGKAILNYDSDDDDVGLVWPLTKKMKDKWENISPSWLCPFGNLFESHL